MRTNLFCAHLLLSASFLFCLQLSVSAQQNGAANEFPVRYLAYSPDGEFLAACYGAVKQKGMLRVWDLKRGIPVVEHTEEAGICSASFSPDGQLLAVGSFTPVGKIINLGTGKVVVELRGHENHVRSVAFINQRVVATSSYDKSVRLWDATLGLELSKLGEHTDECRTLCASPNGRYLVSGASAPDCRLWNLETGKAIGLFEPNNFVCPNVCFSFDGRFFICARWDGKVRIRDVEQQKLRLAVELHAIRAVAVSPDNNLLLGCNDKTTISAVEIRMGDSTLNEREKLLELVRLWRSDDYQVREQASEDIVNQGMTAMPILDRLSKFQSAEIKIRAREAKAALSQNSSRSIDVGHKSKVGAVAFATDGIHVASGDAEGEIRIWRFRDETIAEILASPLAKKNAENNDRGEQED